MRPEVFIYTDFDGTITKKDLGDDLFIQYGQFEPYHTLLISGQLEIKEYWRQLFATLPELDKEFVRRYAFEQETDAYFPAFAKYCEASGIPLAVVSDGFDAYIEPVLEKIGLSELPVYANKMEFSSGRAKPVFTLPSESCKCLVASCKRNRILIKTPPDAVIVYIGDGYSDFCASEHADVIFAKGNLAKYCSSNRIPFHNFNTFFEVLQIIKKLVHDKRLKPRHQAYLKRKSAFESE